MSDKANGEMLLELFQIIFVSKFIWYGIAVLMFLIALFTGKEVYALLALVAAMMRKGD